MCCSLPHAPCPSLPPCLLCSRDPSLVVSRPPSLARSLPHLLPLSALLPSPLRASLSPCPLPLSLDHTLTLVDRDLYPEDKSPYGQWSYMRFYEDHFDEATASFDKNPRNFVKALFRKGSPGAVSGNLATQ